MTRWTVTILGSAVLAAVVGANDPLRPSAAEQARLFQQNRSLLQTLVDAGVEYGVETAPLDRAERCRKAAVKVAEELQQALVNREAGRTEELNRHLNALVERGIVPNLDRARRLITPGSADERRLFEVRAQTDQVFERLGELAPLAGPAGQSVLRSLRQGQTKLDGVVPRP